MKSKKVIVFIVSLLISLAGFFIFFSFELPTDIRGYELLLTYLVPLVIIIYAISYLVSLVPIRFLPKSKEYEYVDLLLRIIATMVLTFIVYVFYILLFLGILLSISNPTR